MVQAMAYKGLHTIFLGAPDASLALSNMPVRTKTCMHPQEVCCTTLPKPAMSVIPTVLLLVLLHTCHGSDSSSIAAASPNLPLT